MQYGEIFGITAIVCVIGGLVGLLIAGKEAHPDESDPDVLAGQPKADNAATQVLPVPRQDPATVQMPRADPRGRHSR
jgi:hypothetical protein